MFLPSAKVPIPVAAISFCLFLFLLNDKLRYYESLVKNFQFFGDLSNYSFIDMIFFSYEMQKVDITDDEAVLDNMRAHEQPKRIIPRPPSAETMKAKVFLKNNQTI